VEVDSSRAMEIWQSNSVLPICNLSPSFNSPDSAAEPFSSVPFKLFKSVNVNLLVRESKWTATWDLEIRGS